MKIARFFLLVSEQCMPVLPCTEMLMRFQEYANKALDTEIKNMPTVNILEISNAIFKF